jgi:ADP-ribose pyrophosphatase
MTDEVAHVWVARGLTFGESEPDEDEKLKVQKLPFSELVDLVMNGKITDSITVCAVLKLNNLMKENEI